MVHFAPDSQTLYTASRRLEVRAWRFSDGNWAEQFRIERIDEAVPPRRLHMAVSAGGTHLAVAASSPQMRLIDIAGRRTERHWESDQGVTGLALSAEAGEVFTCGYGCVRRWSRATGEQTKLAMPSRHAMQDLALSPDGQTLATAGGGGIVRFWDTETWQVREEYRWPVREFRCVRFAPDGLRCAAGAADGTLVVWDVE